MQAVEWGCGAVLAARSAQPEQIKWQQKKRDAQELGGFSAVKPKAKPQGGMTKS